MLILALVDMHVTAHIDRADLAGNAEYPLVGHKQRSTVAVQRGVGRNAAHRDTGVLAEEPGVVNLVLHVLGREGSELGSLLDVFGQRDDVGTGRSVVVDIQRQLVHGRLKQGLGRVLDVVCRTALDRIVKSSEDVIEQRVKQRLICKICQKSNTFPSVAPDIREG